MSRCRGANLAPISDRRTCAKLRQHGGCLSWLVPLLLLPRNTPPTPPNPNDQKQFNMRMTGGR